MFVLFKVYSLMYVVGVVSALALAYVVYLLCRRRFGAIAPVRRAVAGVAAGYALVILAFLLFDTPWDSSAFWRNHASLAVTEARRLKTREEMKQPLTSEALKKVIDGLAGKYDPLDPMRNLWIANRLLDRQKQRDTLIAVSISGGGSRAAYFAAAVLEQLSKVQMPGVSGPGSSVASNIDVLSTVSGGSVAGAYFTAFVPSPADATDAAMSRFFGDFKRAMSQDFELATAVRLAAPRHMGASLLGARTGADALGDVMDAKLFGGKGLTYEALNRRSTNRDAPILVVNATALRGLDVFTFTKDDETLRILQRTQRPDPAITSRLEPIPQAEPAPRRLVAFNSFFGDVDAFRVGDAVAASAAYPPLFGQLRLGEDQGLPRTTALTDGGLIDNSGLLSLYSILLDVRFFQRATNLERIVVIAIDANNPPASYVSTIDSVFAMYDLAQEHLQGFVLPELLRRTIAQELADLLQRPEWTGFKIPLPQLWRFGDCGGQRAIDTRFRVTGAEMEALERAARECVNARQAGLLVDRIQGRGAGRPELYEGMLGRDDVSAWLMLYDIAVAQRIVFRKIKRFATSEEIAANRVSVNGGELLLQMGGVIRPGLDFRFEVDERPGFVDLYATPTKYGQSGRTSMLVSIPVEWLQTWPREVCDNIVARIQGGDFGGRKATPSDPVFLPYGVDIKGRCR